VNAVKEARRLGIPVVGILDSDCDPTLVDIVIPGNDDALKSVRLLIESLSSSVEEGCANRREQQVASGGSRDKGDGQRQPVGDEPRPTRTLRPLPKGLRPRGAQEPTAEEPGGAASVPADAGSEGGATEGSEAEGSEAEGSGTEVAAEAPSGESKAD
jgi:small subunit ribosomal protein S2